MFYCKLYLYRNCHTYIASVTPTYDETGSHESPILLMGRSFLVVTVTCYILDILMIYGLFQRQKKISKKAMFTLLLHVALFFEQNPDRPSYQSMVSFVQCIQEPQGYEIPFSFPECCLWFWVHCRVLYSYLLYTVLCNVQVTMYCKIKYSV